MSENNKGYHPLSLPQIAAWQFPGLSKNDKNKSRFGVGIPSLQRGAVWNPGQIEMLWDSIFRGFPVGALVVCPKNKTQQTRPARHGIGLPEQDVSHHLLDGQQRCNAIALGFLNPFNFDNHLKSGDTPPAVLWIDLAPRKVATSTRQFWFRVLTKAHPWGYMRNDQAGRLGVAEIRKALKEYNENPSEENKLIERCDLLPHSSWPPVGNIDDPKSAAIPVAWLLESIFELNLDLDSDFANQQFWANIVERCRKCDKKIWAKAAIEAIDINKPSEHLNRIMIGLGYAKRLRVVALEVPSDEERADNSKALVFDDGISDVEHLFQRLNNAGTVLGGEELAYSMIKAYWPGIEKSFAALKIRPMAESQLAMLGTRAALLNSADDRNKWPPTLSVTDLRKLAGDSNKRQPVEVSFGLTGESETFEHFRSSDLHKNLNQIDSWLLFNGEPGDFGLPPVLRTSIAQKTPDVFLLLLYIAQQVRDNPVAESFVPALRKHIVAMSTTLYIFADELPEAVAYIFKKIKKIKNLLDNKEPLNEQTFRGIFSGCRDLGKGNLGILNVLKPDDLEILIQHIDENNIDNWSFKNVSFENNLSFLKVLKRSKYLLLYSQREYLCKQFINYDPADLDAWKDHNRPWDFDHILPSSTTYNKKTNITYKPAVDQWINTIGNLRAWPLEKNRSKSDGLASITISEADFADSLIETVQECELFSLKSKDLIDRGKSAAFMNAARNRLLRIYSNWYDGLNIGYLFENP